MVSIIIPTLNEEKIIEALLKEVIKTTVKYEIIISDGGSKDNTLDIAKKYNSVIINAPKGRASQMNIAAKIAKGDILYFLHADSKITHSMLKQIECTILDNYVAGCFSLYFYDYNSFLLRMIAKTSNWRAKYLHLIFGDQGFFIRKDVFYELNGFKLLPIMEDWDISKRVHKLGDVKVLSNKIGTSARRFKNKGVLKTLLFMHWIKLQYILGVDPVKIAKKYADIR